MPAHSTQVPAMPVQALHNNALEAIVTGSCNSLKVACVSLTDDAELRETTIFLSRDTGIGGRTKYCGLVAQFLEKGMEPTLTILP